MDISMIVSIMTGLLSGIAAYLTARYKGKNDSFNSLIEANESFREEIRKDLTQAKKDLDHAGTLMETMRRELEKLKIDLNAATTELDHLRSDLNHARTEREELARKLLSYEVEVKRLQALVHQYEAEDRISASEIIRLTSLIRDLEEELSKYKQ